MGGLGEGVQLLEEKTEHVLHTSNNKSPKHGGHMDQTFYLLMLKWPENLEDGWGDELEEP